MAVLASRARRISSAERTVRHSLQDNLFSDVGHADLRTIGLTLGALDPGEATAVVGALSDDELGVWVRELDGWRGGFTRDEEAALFADLAVRLSPHQLSRLIARGKSVELIEAAVAGATADVQAELALRLWAGRNPTDPGWERIVELVEGASPGAVEAVVDAWPLAVLAVDLLGIHPVGPDSPPRLALDALARFLRVAERFGDPHLKAGIFIEVAQQLAAHRSLRSAGEVSRGDVLGRLAALLRSDAAGVATHLNHAVDPHGNVLAGWIQDMIEADRFDELDVELAQLLGAGDRVTFFSDPGPDPAHPYANAANLGYYVGAYSLAIDGIAGDAEDQINLVAKLFALVTGLVPGPGRSRIRLPLGPLVDVHSESVIEDLRSEAASLKQTLWGLAKPRTPDGLIWNGAGTTQFQDAWEEVVEVR